MSPIKAIDTGTTSATAPITVDEANKLKSRIQESLVEIHQAKKWDEFMDMDDRADVEILEAKLKSELTVINQFLVTGEWSAPAGSVGAGTAGSDASSGMPLDVQPGWNGNATVRKDIPGDKNLVAGAEYAGSVFTNDNGDPTKPLEIALRLDATAVSLEAYNHGSDVVYVETYKDDAGNLKKRYWVGKDQVTNIRASIAIDAHYLDHGVNIDLSRVYRISDKDIGDTIKYGDPAGFTVYGSDFSDKIIGSQGDDQISGLKGNIDQLYGAGGVDTIFGDDDEVFAAARAQGMAGLRADLQDGDDIIDGGAGRDIIDGGGGYNTGYTSDSTSGTNFETVKNIHNTVHSQSTAPAPTSVLTGNSHGWTARSSSPGVIEVSQDSSFTGSSVLDLQMPDGYDMAFGEGLGNGDLKVTMVGTGSDGTPKTFTVIVRGGLDSRINSMNAPYTFKFHGNGGANIIDFHSVDFKNNLVDIDGSASNDMILAPLNTLSADGLTLGDLLDGNNRTSANVTGSAFETIVPHHDEEDVHASGHDIHAAPFNPNTNEIVISKVAGSDNSKRTDLQINPAGYDKAYAVEDPVNPNDLLVVLVKNSVGEGSAPETMVVRIHNYRDFMGDEGRPYGSLEWLILGTSVTNDASPNATQTTTYQTVLIPTPLLHSGNQSGTTLRGGEGDDFVFSSEKDTVLEAETNVQGHYTAPAGVVHNNNAGATTGSGGSTDTGSGDTSGTAGTGGTSGTDGTSGTGGDVPAVPDPTNGGAALPATGSGTT